MISGNSWYNVFLASTEGTTVQGNYIGSDWTGTQIVPVRARNGIRVFTDRDSLIGGTDPGAGNVIVGASEGIFLSSRYQPTQGTRIQGNRIGTTADGQQARANITGILVDGYVDTNGVTRDVFDVLIGGTEPGAGNLISGSQNDGIVVTGPGSEGIVIQGNQIGTDVEGVDALGNGQSGILINDAGGVLVGGTDAGAGNLISGNNGEGITITGNAPSSKTEPFDLAHVSALHGWKGFGNTANRDVFGFSQTHFVNTSDLSSVEAGGTFARASSVLGETSDPVSYYADTRLGGTLTLDDNIHADGELLITALNDFDGSVEIGYLNQKSAAASQYRNLLSLRVGEPSSPQGTDGIRMFAEIVLADGTRVFGTPVATPVGLDPNVLYTWRYDYDPDGGASGQGELVVEVFADGALLGTSTAELTAAHRSIGASFDAFGLHNGGQTVKSKNPNTITLYIDNVTYTRAAGNIIQGNLIGTSANGMSALGNAESGVRIDDSRGNLIGGAIEAARNVISGNTSNGISITGGSSNVVQGNYIGVGRDGVTQLSNFDGVLLNSASETQIGGATLEARNIISGNKRYGIGIGASSLTTIQGNWIGTDASGTAAVGNGLSGIELIGYATDTQIGGTVPSSGNLISGNIGYGVRVSGSGATERTHIEGNLIGTTADGQAALGNGIGIDVLATGGSYVYETTIGGTEPGAGNVISGNSKQGIHVIGTAPDEQVFIQGNLIGTDIGGVHALPNETGVLIQDASGVLVGGIEDGAGNLIAFNTQQGVSVNGDAATGNTIRGNSIHSNGGLGIDLGGDGVTANDIRDFDSGPNDLQNIPVIGLAQNGATTRVAGVLHSSPLSSFTLDFYAITEADPSGHGEGDRWLGSGVVTTDETGNGSYEFILDAATNAERITATATNANGSTSEFSQSLYVEDIPANTLVVTNTNDSGIGSLREAIVAANQIGGTDSARIWFRLPTTDPGFVDVDSDLPGGDSLPDVYLFDPQSALPALTRGNTEIDGESQFKLSGRGKNPFGPMIVLNGSGITEAANGLALASSGNFIHGLTIQQFTGDGVLITEDENTLTGNYIGTDAVGMTAQGNYSGILIVNADHNQIGGGLPGSGNVLSGNAVTGIQLQGDSNDNRIQGNLIGTDAAGTSPIGNGVIGIDVLVFSDSNIIGTDGDGLFDASEGNVISGNSGWGIEIRGLNLGQPTDNVIAGNKIGADLTGTAAVGNALGGIRIWGGDGTRIGSDGDGVGDVDEKNIIIANADDGIFLRINTVNTVIAGNEIGAISDSDLAVGNQGNGIHLQDSTGTIIGGDQAVERNLISGNGINGIRLLRSPNNTIQGNYVGTTSDGMSALGNAESGVRIDDSRGNQIGGANEGARNIISGNSGNGISIFGGSNNNIQGNHIGTTADGLSALGNGLDGVAILVTTGDAVGGIGNVIDRNVISANGSAGVSITATGQGSQVSADNIITGNFIGADKSGAGSLGNKVDGVVIKVSPHNRVGGTSPEERNVIINNGRFGVLFEETGGNFVVGNFVGINPSGQQQQHSMVAGVVLLNDDNSTIGGTVPGKGMLSRGTASAFGCMDRTWLIMPVSRVTGSAPMKLGLLRSRITSVSGSTTAERFW